MSKAFTKESDVEIEESPALRLADLLPEGATNYVTPDGARRMREELRKLISAQDGLTTSAEESVAEVQGKRRRDQRIQELQEMLRGAEVVAPPDEDQGGVRFGAVVTVRDAGGEEFSYRIVGVHETDLPEGWVSWVSPIAKALMNARVGDKIRFQAPAGEMRLEIIRVDYPQE